MQEATFPVEVLINDDASTDGTAEIVREYENRYPGLIRSIYQTENQYSKGIKPNVTFNLPRARGKYIALCEGDDFWTAAHKLQVQVDFLQNNSAYVGCFHNAEAHYQNQLHKSHLLFNENQKDTVTLEDLVLENRLATLSTVYRANLFDSFPEWYNRMPFGDWALHVLNAEHGPFRYINQNMAVYRIHDAGVWSRLGRREQILKMIVVANAINVHLNFRYANVIQNRIGYWHYEIATELSRSGKHHGIFVHLLQALRHMNKEIPKKDYLRLVFKHSFPWLYSHTYWRLQRLSRAVRRQRA